MIKFVSYPFSSKSYLSALRKYALLTTGLVTISFPALSSNPVDVDDWDTLVSSINAGNSVVLSSDNTYEATSDTSINVVTKSEKTFDVLVDGKGATLDGKGQQVLIAVNSQISAPASLKMTNVNMSYFSRPSSTFLIGTNGEVTLSGYFTNNSSDKFIQIFQSGATLNVDADVETKFDNSGYAIYNESTSEINLKSTNADIIFNDPIFGTGGTINVSGNNTVFFNQAVTGNNIKLTSGTLDVSDGGSFDSNTELNVQAGTFKIGTQSVSVKNATFNMGSVLSLLVDAASNGSLSATTWAVSQGAKLVVALTTGAMDGNDSKTVILLKGGNISDEVDKFEYAEQISANNNMYTFEATENAGEYTITKTSSGSDVSSNTGGTQNNANTAAAWVDSGNAFPAGSTSAAVAEKLHNLAQLDNKGDYNAALTALAPEVSPVVQAVSMEIIGQVFQAVSSRLSSGNVTAAAEGKSSGDSLFEKVATWVQVLTNKTELDTANGFDMDTNGIAMGVEKRYDANWKIGAGYSYGDSDIEAFLRDVDVSSHTFFTYAEYKPSNWFVNAVASYTFSDMEESKHVAGGVYGAKYDVNALGLQVMTGYDTLYRGVNVTPHAGLRYYRIDRDSYTDGAGQRVKSNTMDVLTAVAGAKVSKDFTTCGGTHWKPEARLAMTYDIISDEDNAVVGLSNGTNYMIQGDRLDRFGVETGVGVVVDVNDQVETRVGYEGKFRDDYTDHSGMLNVMYKF